MTSRTITSVVTPDTIALNAAVFGYAGHSIVTPHAAIQKIWWTDERIEAKVTPDFINSKLLPDERKQLNKPLSFGADLTDETYLEWILERARRLYLILVECGVSDQIFGVIDDGWTDSDLPIPLDEIDRLALSYKYDEKLNKRFYSTQFSFLLRTLSKDIHVDYASNEVIPLEFIHRLPPAAALQSWLRVHLPKKPDVAYVRRRVLLGSNGELDKEQVATFQADVETSRVVQHEHLAPIWASYTHKEHGYTLTSFESEHTLKSFIEFRSAASLQKMSKAQKYCLFLTWLHCLADAVACLHRHGVAHTAISPSNIVIDGQNIIAFSDVGSLKTFQLDKKMEASEPYTYGAPENFKKSEVEPLSPGPASALNSYRFATHLRKKSTESRKSLFSISSSTKSAVSLDSQPPGLSRSSQSSSIYSRQSFESVPGTPDSVPMPTREPPPVPRKDSDTIQPMSLLYSGSLEPPMTPSEPPDSPATPSIPSEVSAGMRSDVFSLGCIFLDILSYMLKKKPSDFVKHRATKRRNNVVQASNGNVNSPKHSAHTSTASTASTASNASNASNASSTSKISLMSSNSTSSTASAVPPNRTDTSFHDNPGKLDSWMTMLETDASIQEDQVFRAIPYLTRLIRDMLHRNPQFRPCAAGVRDRVFDILISHAGLPSMHCCGSVDGKGKAYSHIGPALPGVSRRPFSNSAALLSPQSTASSSSSPTSDSAAVRQASGKAAGGSTSLMTGGFARSLGWARTRKGSTAGLGN